MLVPLLTDAAGTFFSAGGVDVLAEGTGQRAFVNRPFAIQMILILGIVIITAWLFMKRGAKQLAIRRLLIIFFAIFAVFTVIFPTVLTKVANFVGVGRGADLLLYATVVVLLGFLALQEARAKNEEKRTTHLARRLALDEAIPPQEYRDRHLTDQ